MSSFALVQPPEPEQPEEPLSPTKGQLKAARRAAAQPQPTEESIPLSLSEAGKARYRDKMLARSPYCVYCGKRVKPSTATAEHAIPRARGGGNTPANLWLACRRCNTFKADLEPLEWLQQLYDACVRMGLLRDDDGEIEHAIFYAAGGWD